MRLFKYIGLSIVLAGLVAPLIIQFWHWNQENHKVEKSPVAVFSNIFPANKSIPKKESEDCYRYDNQRIEIWRCNDTLKTTKWESPEGWKITEVISADLNRDGVDEFGLLVWRLFESWPIDKFLPNKGRIANFHDQDGQSCHFILIGWNGNEYRELWAGSAMASPISQVRVGDIDGDGLKELIAIEGKYDGKVSGDVTIWKWQGFGFSLVERLEGNYSDYELIEKNKQLIVLTD